MTTDELLLSKYLNKVLRILGEIRCGRVTENMFEDISNANLFLDNFQKKNNEEIQFFVKDFNSR